MVLRIKDMKYGDTVSGLIVCRMAGVREGANGPYLDIKIFDSKNEINGKFWNYSGDAPPPNTVVHISGLVESYRDNLQLKLDEIRVANEDEYQPQDFLAKSPYDPEETWNNLKQLADGVQNSYLRELLDKALFEQPTVKKYFCMMPGAKYHHHSYISGLLDHSYNVANMVVAMANYSKAKINFDLLITGAILHDIGKIKEYKIGVVIEVTDDYNFAGHIFLGANYISKVIDGIKDFPCDLKSKLINIILSHHGTKQDGHGSAVDPVQPEAYIIHVCDKADTVLFKFNRAREEAEVGQRWQRIWGIGAGKSDFYVGD